MNLNATNASVDPQPGIDPRGPRFAAAMTSILLLGAVYFGLTGTSSDPELGGLALGVRVGDVAFVILAMAALLFTWSVASPRTQPWAVLFRNAIEPRLAEPPFREDPRPPRFAQTVGLTIVTLGLLLHLLGVPWAIVIAAVAAFVAAALNALFGFCLGCQLYVILMRARNFAGNKRISRSESPVKSSPQ